ncbi:Rho-binding antiterminator [Photobacterium chitinilyticum]|uniref:Transcriptional antiterminator n=1 Tax=Photobacterium chitinilyticum TaxID=2485123 RepID=A0A3S4TMF3_9GAMM|nr:Rho-binding antiterminator [Photobacterium chitinilyticum]RWX55731.1 transcriptional antiterminator [Photobacterium chitinilyticum]
MTHRYQPIDCALHDCFEMACVYHYQVKLDLRDESSVEGKCITTETHPDKSEWLVFKTEYQYTKIRLDFIERMSAITPGARFSVINC